MRFLLSVRYNLTRILIFIFCTEHCCGGSLQLSCNTDYFPFGVIFYPSVSFFLFYLINLACCQSRPYWSNFSVQMERKRRWCRITLMVTVILRSLTRMTLRLLDHWDAALTRLVLIALLMVFLREINVSLCIIHFDKLNNWSDGSFRRPELWLMACHSKFSSFFFPPSCWDERHHTEQRSWTLGSCWLDALPDSFFPSPKSFVTWICQKYIFNLI